MDELTAGQCQELEQDLRALSETLPRLLEESVAGARPVDLDEPIGRLSRMDAMQQQHMAQANRLATQRRLAGVQAALRRIEEDAYGECGTCGEAIGYPRLKVSPEAVFCLACQTQRER